MSQALSDDINVKRIGTKTGVIEIESNIYYYTYWFSKCGDDYSLLSPILIIPKNDFENHKVQYNENKTNYKIIFRNRTYDICNRNNIIMVSNKMDKLLGVFEMKDITENKINDYIKELMLDIYK
ncbi:hypothetical protein QPK87_30240 [Kamptonema cortianum]|nr:hypothetical protein [Kamptonema cortianum]